MNKLLSIQKELKAPKGQFNDFGKYKYRSTEDILEAVKPLLVKHECILTVEDELVNIGERYYIKATAILRDTDKETIYSISGYAREEENRKGMDQSQITGTASSYARKYALNGMFAIDDSMESDLTNDEPALPEMTKQNTDVVEAICENLKGKITSEWEIDTEKVAKTFLSKHGNYPSNMDAIAKAADWLIGLKQIETWATKKKESVLSKKGEAVSGVLSEAFTLFTAEHDPDMLGEWDFDLFVAAATKRWKPLPVGKTAAKRIADSLKPEDVKPKTLGE